MSFSKQFTQGIGAIGLVLILLAVVAVLIGIPFATVWAINTLFGLTIPYTVWTWLAMLILQLSLTTSAVSKK